GRRSGHCLREALGKRRNRRAGTVESLDLIRRATATGPDLDERANRDGRREPQASAAPVRTMTAGKRWLGVALGILLSAVFLYLALRKVDGNELRSALESARWWTTGPFLAVLFAYYWIKTVRWTYVLRGVAPGTSARLFPAVMVGYAAGALLPMQLGELVRAWLGADRLRIRLLASLASIALERVFDLLSIALLAALALTIGIRASPPWLLPAI